jgi:hypothetical protein
MGRRIPTHGKFICSAPPKPKIETVVDETLDGNCGYRLVIEKKTTDRVRYIPKVIPPQGETEESVKDHKTEAGARKWAERRIRMRILEDRQRKRSIFTRTYTEDK